METSISSSTEASLVYLSNLGKQDSLCDWMPGNRNGVSVANCCAETLERNGVSHVEHRNVAVGDTVMPLACNREPRRLKDGFANGCSIVDDHSFDDVHKTVMQKTIDVDSINDSCSLSKSNMDLLPASTKGEVDENGECTFPSVIAAEVVREDLFEKGKWLPVLQLQKNVEEIGLYRACASEEIGISGGSSCSRLCNICGRSGTTQKMLICDSCEEAFHMHCCNPKIKKIPVDEWYCISCMKKKRIMLKETIARRSSKITGGMRSGSPIELMLRDAEPYRTSL